MKYREFDAQTLACLPSASLTRMASHHKQVFPSPCPTLVFTSYGVDNPDNTPLIVQRSLQNLVRCPAWQLCGPAVHISLDYVDMDDTQLITVLGALAPLVGKEVSVSFHMPEADVGAPEVQQLGGALGSSLKKLVLQECYLSEDFWRAVWAHLPGLQQLTVQDGVYGATGATELIFFCSRATRPLHLHLGQALHQQWGVQGKLEKQCQLWGVPQVTVSEL
jgi:hypothetical protein